MSFDIAKRKGLPTVADVKAGRVSIRDIEALLPGAAAIEAIRRWLDRYEGREIQVPAEAFR